MDSHEISAQIEENELIQDEKVTPRSAIIEIFDHLDSEKVKSMPRSMRRKVAKKALKSYKKYVRAVDFGAQ